MFSKSKASKKTTSRSPDELAEAIVEAASKKVAEQLLQQHQQSQQKVTSSTSVNNGKPNYENVLTPLKCGYMNKFVQHGSAKRRWFILRGPFLLYYISDKKNDDPKGVILVENCRLEVIESETNGKSVTNENIVSEKNNNNEDSDNDKVSDDQGMTEINIKNADDAVVSPTQQPQQKQQKSTTQTTGGGLLHRASLSLSRFVNNTDHLETDYFFVLRRPTGRWFRLCCDSQEEMQEWINVLEATGLVKKVVSYRKKKTEATLQTNANIDENDDHQDDVVEENDSISDKEENSSESNNQVCYSVSNAGTTKVNGHYKKIGEHKFINEEGVTLSREFLSGSYGWVLGFKPSAYYGVKTDSELPPSTGWRCYEGKPGVPNVEKIETLSNEERLGALFHDADDE